MAYTFAQLEALWEEAGGSSATAPIAAAIALAESSGNPQQVNAQDPGGSYGLWQINGAAHPQYNTQWLLDPMYNAQAAVQVAASSGWGAWSTWQHGAAQQILQAQGVPFSSVIGSTGAPSASAGAAPSGPQPLSADLSASAKALIAVGVGIGLLVLGGSSWRR